MAEAGGLVSVRRIVFVYPAASAGGIATFVHSLGEELHRQGFDVRMIQWRDKSSPYSPKKRGFDWKLHVETVVFDSRDKAGRVGKLLAKQFGFRDGDCIVSQSFPWISDLIHHVQKRVSISHVEFIHGEGNTTIARAARLVATCDLYCAVSYRIAQQLRDHFNSRSLVCPNIAVIPCGVSVPPVMPDRHDCDAIRICYIGRLVEHEKRINDLLLLAIYLSDNDISFELNVAGKGPYLHEFIKNVALSQLKGNIHLSGYIPHRAIAEFLSNQDVIVITSPNEGGPIVVPEAMAQGVVPVATRVGMMEDIIVTRKNGYLVDVGDVRGMGTALEELYKNRDLLKEMSCEAYKTAREKLDIAIRAEEFVAMLDRVTPRSDRRQPSPQRRSVLDCAWIPNSVTRTVRRAWRKFRGPPADL